MRGRKERFRAGLSPRPSAAIYGERRGIITLSLATPLHRRKHSSRYPGSSRLADGSSVLRRVGRVASQRRGDRALSSASPRRGVRRTSFHVVLLPSESSAPAPISPCGRPVGAGCSEMVKERLAHASTRSRAARAMQGRERHDAPAVRPGTGTARGADLLAPRRRTPRERPSAAPASPDGAIAPFS